MLQEATEFAPMTSRALAARLMDRLESCASGRVEGAADAVPFARIRDQALAVSAMIADAATGPVAICAHKQPAAVSAMLGVLCAGRAYAPLDPTHPTRRWTDILERLQPAAILVDMAARDKIETWAARADIPLLPLVPSTLATGAGNGRSEGDCAAVLHTSGSTGVPKQVRIGADAISVFCDWVGSEFGLTQDDVLLSHAPLAFDLSFLDIFAGMAAGASVVLADAAAARSGARLCRLIGDTRVTFLHATPSALGLIADAAGGRTFPLVRCVLFAGEPMPAARLSLLAKVFPNARLTNIYGCTETNDTFFYDVPAAGNPDPLPLGRPLPYTDHVVMTDSGHPAAAGEEGELWVRCPTMMIGYSDPDLTARAIGTYGGKTYYRSGDRVRTGEDGLVYILGRIDSVRKVNGYRVDLAEIEACLSRHPGVRENAVFVGPNGQLAAVLSCDVRQVNSVTLRRHAMQALPAYAIPKSFRLTPDPLPKNSNGKICRKTIAASHFEAAVQTA